jgi:cytoplasmic iron level regulating protein YaaA (DUF328/UPF0246 family)
MLVLLPPSETKRDGGAAGSTLDLDALSFPELTAQRRTTVAALRRLSRSVGESMRALRLGPALRSEVDRNRAVLTSPVMPAIDRYTGVLYDALDAGSLGADERAFLASSVAVHSALFGLVGALDPVPAYRLSHDSRLPGIRLAQHWAPPISAVLAATPGLVLDLRSEGYVKLGPAPGAVFLRVVTEGADGRVRAMNHFNKSAKGRLVRALAQSRVEHPDLASLLTWAERTGIRLRESAGGAELQLLV